MIDVMSFEDLEIKSTVDIISECERHSAQAGSVFGRRQDAKYAVELAEDNVKYVRGKLSAECRIAGVIPGFPKMTDKALAEYVDCHPEMVEARTNRAEAIKEYDNVLGLVTAYNAKKDMLALIRSERQNSFHSDVNSSRVGDVGFDLK